MTRVIYTPICRTPMEPVELANGHGAKDDDVARQLELANSHGAADDGDDLVELANSLADVLDTDDDADPELVELAESVVAALTDEEKEDDVIERIIEMTDARMADDGTDALTAAAEAGDYDALADTFASMAAAADDDTDPVAELDAELADYQPYELDKYQKATMQATDRAEYLARGVPSTLVETAMPALYSGSAKVRAAAAEMLERGVGVEPESDRYNRVLLALHDLLNGAGLRPNAQEFGRARQEDSPSEAALLRAWEQRFDKPAAPAAGDGETAREYRPSRGWW